MKVLFNPEMIFVLAATLAVYWIILRQENLRLLLLTTVSFFILASLHPIFATSVLGILLLTHLHLCYTPHQKKGRFLFCFLVAALLFLGIGKYGKEIFLALGRPDDWVSRFLIVPLGISYFVFRWLQYVMDTYRGILRDHSFLRFATFIFFFPTIPAGPLESFQRFYDKREVLFKSRLFHWGLQRIIWGYFKKLFVIELIFHALFGDFTSSIINGSTNVALAAPYVPLAFVFLMFVRAYLDLSAYTDIAVGLGALFGFRIIENFEQPFLKDNLAAFWRSWHISLSHWCRNHIYFPLFGKTRLSWLAIYASMITMGLWHHLDLNWLTWGLYHGTGLVFLIYWNRYKKRHSTFRNVVNSPIMKPLGVILTLLFVSMGYAFVAIPNYGHAWKVFLACFQNLTHLIVT